MCAEFSFLSQIHALWFITLSAFVHQTSNSQRGRTLMMPPCDNLGIIDEDIAYILGPEILLPMGFVKWGN